MDKNALAQLHVNAAVDHLRLRGHTTPGSPAHAFHDASHKFHMKMVELSYLPKNQPVELV